MASTGHPHYNNSPSKRMGFISRISRVRVFVVWKSSCRLKVGCRRCIWANRSHRWSVIIGFTYILDTSFYVQYHLLLLLSRNPPSQISELSVSKEGPRILRLRIGSCISLQRELQL